eukprot:1577068-Pleurochrysis_carterae.AAC.2
MSPKIWPVQGILPLAPTTRTFLPTQDSKKQKRMLNAVPDLEHRFEQKGFDAVVDEDYAGLGL